MQAHETVLELNLKSLAHNYRYLRSKIPTEVKFMAVVKAFAYGSEVVTIAQELESLGADYLAVAYTSEGITLRKAGIKLPILIFHPQSTNFDALFEYLLEPSLYSVFNLEHFIKAAETHQQTHFPIHLKFNTGMNRLGFSEEEIPKIATALQQTQTVKPVSFLSHLAASEDWREREFSLQQIHTFKRMAFQLYNELDSTVLLHICNTSGIINYPEASFDMVRSGIGLFGYANDPIQDNKLQPVASLKTIISQLHELKKGDSVGYNRAFKATKPTKTATLPIGYADGIGREFGNGKAGVFINGAYAPIIGNVCMDMVMVDVTGIPCQEGDEVLIFGPKYPASDLAKLGDTISYEVITRVSQRVKRRLLH